MRIAMVTSFPPRRCGVGDWVADLLPHLTKAGAEIDVVTYPEDGPDPEVGEGVRLHRTLPRGPAPFEFARAVERAADGADAVVYQSQMFLHSRLANLAPRLTARRPTVTVVHDTPAMARLIHASWFLRRLYASSDLLVSLSEVTRRELVGRHRVPPSKIRSLSFGVDPSLFHPRLRSEANRAALGFAADEVVVLFLGFLNRGKGVVELVEAAAQAMRVDPAIRLAIAGDTEGPLGQELLAQATALGVRDRIRPMGWVDTRTSALLLANADVVALPYVFSYQSAVLFRSLGSGSCILASDIPGFRAWLEDDVTARFVRPRDVESIRDGILSLARDPALRARLGAAAAREAEMRHNLSEVARSLVGVAEEAIAVARRGN